MAGDWIKVEAKLLDKPEVFAITAKLGWADPDLTVGKLLRVWRWFDQHTVDGNAAGVTPALLDNVAGVTGFADAMAAVHWLNVHDDGLTLPNFDYHNSETAKQRALTARRVAKHKTKGNAKGNGAGNAASVTPALPREEKRREDLSGTDTSSPDPVEPAAPVDDAGCFEGHENPAATPNPVARFAIALSRAGVRVTSLNPDLIAFEREGGTPDALVELAQGEEFRGKPATYIIRAARRMLAESAAPPAGRPPRPSPPQAMGKTASVVADLERQKRELVDDRNNDGHSTADLPQLRAPAGR